MLTDESLEVILDRIAAVFVRHNIAKFSMDASEVRDGKTTILIELVDHDD